MGQRRLTFNVLEGIFDYVDVEDVREFQEKILCSVLIGLDYGDSEVPRSCVLTSEANVLWNEIPEDD